MKPLVLTNVIHVTIIDEDTWRVRRFSFRSKNQLDFFMIREEDWVFGEVIFARVVWSTYHIHRAIKRLWYRRRNLL